MAKQTRVQKRVKPGHRAHKRDSVALPTPAGGNHAERRKARREAERAKLAAEVDAALVKDLS